MVDVPCDVRSEPTPKPSPDTPIGNSETVGIQTDEGSRPSITLDDQGEALEGIDLEPKEKRVVGKIFIETRKKIFMRKDNYMYFVSTNGDPCDTGSRELQERDILPKFSKLEVGTVKSIRHNNRCHLVIPIRRRDKDVLGMALFDDLDQGLIYQDGWTRVLGGVDSIEGIEEVLLLPFVTRLDLMRLAVTRGMINIFRDLILYCTELDSDAVIGLIDHACLSVRYEFLDIIAQAVTHIEPHNGDHMLGLLISFGGLDVNERDRMGMSPLRAALCYNRPQLADRLIEMYDANVTEQTVEDLEPLIYEVLEHPSEIELIKLFVLRGCDLFQPDSNGNYPIHCLARCNAEGTRELFPLLAKTGTNFANSANKHGATPLQFAVWNDNLELIKLLEKYGSIELKKDFKMLYYEMDQET
ncbi:hypothetical protein QAD02_021888 [Eretmocerus hayati]|uniref:Uncharacterized protein n=1 Tax=Eretmocerus hayati TaxID=131215 RepID=A0ACC2PR69_9HYME|nr:hypothetical protein QAD02_021888 [Eretmocerus hayati]